MQIPKMYDIELTSSNYNPDANTSITITATATDYNGNPVLGESLIIKHNGVAIGSAITTNSSGQATVTTTCGSAGTHQFTCKSASCVISVNPYPVGAIYTSIDSTSPETLFGGTWAQLTNTFLYASTTADSDVTTAPSGQGEATHTLTGNEMPSHNHRVMDWTIIVSANGNSGSTTMGSGKLYHPAKDDRDVRYSYNSGGGAAHNNMPPYMKVYMWKRTA